VRRYLQACADHRSLLIYFLTPSIELFASTIPMRWVEDFTMVGDVLFRGVCGGFYFGMHIETWSIGLFAVFTTDECEKG